MSSAPAPALPPRRPLALSALLVLLSVGSLIGLWKALAGSDEFFSQYPRIRALWIPYLCIPALNVVSAIAIWHWRRWGFWLTVALAVATMAIEFSTMGPEPHVWRVPVALALLAWLVRRQWGRFR